ncbi:MAG: sodium/proton-translocating pyrophosphatase, partial [Actinomycetales bacterium]
MELSTSSLVIAVAVGVLAVGALAFALVLRQQVLREETGTASMVEIARAVQEGASAYLRRQFRTLGVFVVVITGLLLFLPADLDVRIGRSVAFLVGAVFSAAIGYLGMWLAVRANVRVAAAATRAGGRADGARIAFRTGGVVGMSVVGLGLLGASLTILVFRADAPTVLEGFGFGAALLAMFMRVGGGIFTKAADVGADLVGKVEQGIPEDDPRNAATIADNVGDNVGDCAGMAADLFESYAVTLVASLILGRAALGEHGMILPLLVTAVGAVVAVLGVLTTRVRGAESGLKAIYRGFYTAAVVGVVLAAVAAFVYLPSTFADTVGTAGAVTDVPIDDPRVVTSLAVLIGVALAGVILWLTGFYTGTGTSPTQRVAATSRTGAATVVLAGIGVGFESAVYTAGVIAAAICGCFLLSGGSIWLALFLVALAGCGLLTT